MARGPDGPRLQPSAEPSEGCKDVAAAEATMAVFEHSVPVVAVDIQFDGHLPGVLLLCGGPRGAVAAPRSAVRRTGRRDWRAPLEHAEHTTQHHGQRPEGDG